MAIRRVVAEPALVARRQGRCVSFRWCSAFRVWRCGPQMWRSARCPELSCWLLGLSVVQGCAGQSHVEAAQAAAASTPSPGDRSSSEVERFLPLIADTVLTYRVWLSESANAERLILQVDRPAPDRADLRSGNTVKRIELVAGGARLLTGGYLLAAPLALGAEWSGPAGRVRITAVDQRLSVPAGQFVGCLETTETATGAGSSRSIVTTYCPDVGIVKLSVDDGERLERLELESFGPRVDIDDL